MEVTKGFVLLSGGIDSSTALGFAIRDLGRDNVMAYSVDYGQRHRKEMDQASRVANYFSVPHKVLEIIGIPKVMLTDPTAKVPDVSYQELTGVSPTYVPFRNGQLISRIAGEAAHQIDRLNVSASEIGTDDKYLGVIYFGAHAEDAAGDAYPDCRFDFVGAMAAAVYIGSYHQLRLRAPLIEMFKDEIVTAGVRLGVPYHLTWSCYKGEELHCGTCPTCRARKAGFIKAGVNDPTQYAA